jgi:molybdate transport system substrate-binding protein
LADLADVDVVSLCGLTVPCGKYAAQVLQSAGVTIPETKVTRGIDVKGTLAAVTTGDADAAIVYVTDAQTAGEAVARVTIPDPQNAIATYPIATLNASGNKATSRAFIDYVMSSKGQATLRSYGFLPPS